MGNGREAWKVGKAEIKNQRHRTNTKITKKKEEMREGKKIRTRERKEHM